MTPDADDFAFERRFPLKEVVVLAVLASLVLVFILATSQRTRCDAYRVQCATNLRAIYAHAMAYSEISGTRQFPLGPSLSPRAHESLNVMLASAGPGPLPEEFVCPAGDAVYASYSAGGTFTLNESTLGYAWCSRRLGQTMSNLPLASDKYVDGYRDAAGEHSGHKGGLNVLMTDNRVEFVRTSELPPGTLLPAGLTR